MRGRIYASNMVFRMVVHATLWVLVLLLAGVLISIIPNVSWGDFVSSLKEPDSVFALKLTTLCVSISTVLCVVLAIPAAYALSRHRVPLASVVDTILDLPIVLPQLIAGIALLMFFQTAVGKVIGAPFPNLATSPAGVVLAIFFPTISLTVRSMKAGFDSVDPRYEQVARTLGCTEAQAFWRVALPLARNGLIAGAVLNWAYSLGVFGSVIMYCGAARMSTDVIPVAVFLNMTTGRIAAGVSLTLLLLAVAAVSLVIFKRLGGRATLA